MQKDQHQNHSMEPTPKGNHKDQMTKPSMPYFPGMRVQRNTVIPEVASTPIQPQQQAISTAYVNAPVVIGETTIQLNLDGNTEFPEPVLEIKEIKRNLKLTQCRLLLPTNKLFLKGVVRKNITYATPKQSTARYIVSRIHSLTTDIPFEAVTEIEFINQPIFHPTPEQENFFFFAKEKLIPDFSHKRRLLSRDFALHEQVTKEVFNEEPYCELISSKFIEFDEAIDRKTGRVIGILGERMEVPFDEGTFYQMEEKMIVEITLRVLQKQQVIMD
ncbi:DUF3794 domain-containing protein [Caldibacillus lycopersici]|uniref:DUF3794 domain-containing protein n=1 Tax=Perspicuibacillus lycopersici TaxID=1325689 RepID=A0AAE3IVU0_9BACI|nr:DUF3794 domain-containing protein [Perspicuibacillus lycopersici]MCU9614538.1 DUF3794 domain-containing protein [Perspicuibacillus lycopersici]